MTTRTFLSASCAFLASALLPNAAPTTEFPKGSPHFHTSYSKLLAEQKATGKPAIIIFSAAWCAPCQSMKKSVYPHSTVVPFHDQFVWAYLDGDDPKNKPAMEKYAVQGIPHIEFLNRTGKSLAKQTGPLKAKEFTKKLQEVLNAEHK
ncbi:MAG: thioredoxin family protein [Luteolibacter sp.]